jgi:hypothetical protein
MQVTTMEKNERGGDPSKELILYSIEIEKEYEV